MKRLLKITFLLTILMSMVGFDASAHDIIVKNADGVTIYYNFFYNLINNNTELVVTYKGSSYDSYSNEYYGNVVIPESVTYNGKTYSVTNIGSRAFSGCSGLTSVTIPNSVTSIGQYAFSGCSGLTSVTIPNSVTSIGSSAFWGCSGLTSITIPNSVTSIGSSAFDDCTGLTSITIPNSVTSIGKWAFSGCSGLTSVTVNSNYILSGTSSSKNMRDYFGSQVKTYILGNNVTSIGQYAFYCCSNLYSITIPNSVTSIGGSAFKFCSGLTSIKVLEGNTKYDSRNNCNAIIETATNTLVTGCKNTIIPNNVTSIGGGAFWGCSGLTSITIPNSVTSIGNSAFFNCDGLTSVKVLEGNTKYDSRSNCNAIIETATNTLITGCKNTIIPNSVTSIGERAFYGCSGLASITIPNSVMSIGGGAFSDCHKLTYIYSDIEVPTSATGSSFDNSTYSDATLYVPYGTKDKYLATEGWKNFANIGYASYIGGIYYEFSETGATVVAGANKYTGSITIPASVIYGGKTYSVTSIGGGAFDGCSGLTSITIPNSVTSIGGAAFFGCSELTSIKVQEGNTKYDSRSNCNAIIETATNTLVAGCKNTTIPNSVTSIGERAFYDCSGLTSITIPNSVTSIGNSAFYNCDGLTSVYSNIAAPTNATGSSFGNSTYSKATLYVPYGTKDKYLATEGWKNFKYIKEDKNIGVCGNNLTYTYSSGELTIHGTGAMYDYSKSSPVPWDSYKNDIMKIVIEDGARSIGDYAFSGCSNLYSITIPNSVTRIGEMAFYSCGQTSITIPNSVKSIGESAFSNCDGLTSVTIGNSVTSIGNYAFQYCSKLTSVTIPNSVTSIGFYAFYRCSGLTSVTIGNGVISIGEHAFYGCSGLTSVTIGNSVNYIGDYAFDGCSKLASVTFHCNNVGRWFSGKSSVKEVWIEKEVTSIAQQSFAGCSGLQSVYNNAKDAFTIAKNTFDDATYSNAKLYVPTGMKATYEETPWWVNFKKIEEMSGKYILTYKVDGKVYKQYEVAYGTTITPEPAPTKEGYIFSGWSEIPTTMPARDVTVTGTFTVKYTLTYKVDGEVYKQYEVAYGSAITPEPAPSKTGYTFSGWSEIPTTMPANNVIVTGTFTDDSYVGGIYYNYSDTEVTVVSGANKYTGDVTIPASVSSGGKTYSVTSIGDEAFFNCTGLTSVSIPNSVKSIGSSAFEYCSGLSSITIPNSVTSIGNWAFYDCKGLTSIKVQEGNTKYDSRNNCNAIIETATNTLVTGCKNTIIPNNVTSIGGGAFWGCSGLTSVTIPNSVTSIVSSAFHGCI